MKPGERRALDNTTARGQLSERVEKLTTSVQAKVEPPIRVIKRQFGHIKVCHRRLKRNTVQLDTFFALPNLWMVRRKLMKMDG